MPTKRAKKGAAHSRKPKQAPEKHDVAADAAREWPPNLEDELADALFDEIEGGSVVKAAAEKVGLKGQDVYKWKHRHAKFAARLEEAETIGRQMILDDIVIISDTASCRDSAAGAKERREARMEHLRIRDPAKHHVSPFRAPLPGSGQGGELLGVILVPMKVGQEPTATKVPIEGTAIRVPNKQLAPPA